MWKKSPSLNIKNIRNRFSTYKTKIAIKVVKSNLLNFRISKSYLSSFPSGDDIIYSRFVVVDKILSTIKVNYE